MTQLGFFNSEYTWYVQRCLESGAKIVAHTKGTIGTILCPFCKSEADLSPTFKGNKIVSYQCHCGKEFPDQDAVILTFQ